MPYVDQDIHGIGSASDAQLRAAITQRGRNLAEDYAPSGLYREPTAGVEAVIREECVRYPGHEVDHDGVTVQINVETAGMQSTFWIQRANPGGIGAVDNNPDLALWFNRDNLKPDGNPVPREEAERRGIRAHVAKLLNYRFGEGDWTDDDPRAFAIRDRNWMRSCRTWRDLKGKWATSSTYDTTMESVWTALASIGAATLPGEESPVLHVAIAAGHVNTAGGNPEEIVTVRPLVTEITRQLRAAGVQVTQITPDTGLYPGDHNAVARAVLDLDSRERVDLYWECHTEGTGNPANRGSFGVVPFWPEDNPADQDGDAITISFDLATRLETATGLPIKETNVIRPGVMAEYQTGVGGQGFRLGVFANTDTAKDHMTRCIYEYGAHTSPPDLAIQRQPWFSERAARATVAAIAAFYGLAAQPGGGMTPPVSDWPKVPTTERDPWRNHLGGNPWGRNWWIPRIFVQDIMEHGGFNPVGFVMSEAMAETNDEGVVLIVQYFERGKIELHEAGYVTRALIGRDELWRRYPERKAA